MQIPEIPNLINYAIPFFAVTEILEVILTVKIKLEDYEFKDTGSSILIGLGNVAISIITKGTALSLFYLLYNLYHVFEIPFTWWAWGILLFAEDFFIICSIELAIKVWSFGQAIWCIILLRNTN